MDPREHLDFSAWPPILIVILLATTSAFLARMTLESERPPPSGQGVSTAVIQDRDARLWQDPFGVAVTKSEPPDCYEIASGTAGTTLTLRRCREATGSGSSPDLGWLRTLVEARKGQVTIVYGLVPGGTWVGADEIRRRHRYAILAGANLQRYIPEDPEHLGFVEGMIHSGLDARADWRASVPFEWLSHEDGDRYVLLLWVDEETLGQAVASGSSPAARFPLTRLTALIETLAVATNQPPPGHRVIGPFSSSFLRAVTTDPNLEPAADNLSVLGVHWYSPSATLPDDLLTVSLRGVRRTLGGILPDFQRMIVSDDALAQSLAEELRRRHVAPDEAVALVGLWDTAYSRRLRDLIDQHIQLEFPPGEAPTVVTASYLRGVDGRLPNQGQDPKNGGQRDDRPAERVERPEGDAQVDYLRRLALDLKRRQREMGKRIAAIGIIGDDYHDKLLALRALRPSFPGPVFFTTDLDAAMLHPADNKVTRNLVVASGFGLSLRQELQGDIPPFRYSYQSAAFLAAEVALGDGSRFALPARAEEEGCLLRAQLFEIGYTEAVELAGGRVAGPCDVAAPFTDPRPCAPSPPGLMAFLKLPAGVLLAGLLLWVTGVMNRGHLVYWVWGLAVTVVLALGMALLLNHAPQMREPFSLFQGVSIWPSQFLRLLAVVLAVCLFLKGRRLSHDSIAKIEDDYPELVGAWGNRAEAREQLGLGMALKRVRRCLARSGAAGPDPYVPGLWGIFAGAHPGGNGASPSGASQTPDSAGGTATRAAGAECPPLLACLPFWAAAILFLSVVMLTATGLIAAFGEAPNTPARGDIEWWINRLVLMGAVLSFLLLLFQASYESFRSVWLARSLQAGHTWPEATLRCYQPQLHLRGTGPPPFGSALDRWLDVELIARVTEPVQRIVFYPFAVMALLILARSPLFDAWDIPGFLLTLLCIYVALVVAAAWRLRTTAERLRRRAEQEITRDVMDARIAGAQELAAQLQAMLDYLKSLATGAFLPFSQQPLVRAALTVLGSYSGITLLEYARLVNL